VLSQGLASSGDAEAIGRRLADAIAEPFEVDGRMVRIGASVGIAVGEGPTASDLLPVADEAMYEAKATERNVVVRDLGSVGR
jgi:GGDEF domain-containing protein